MDQQNNFQNEVLAYLVRHANGDISAMTELKTMIQNHNLNQPTDTEGMNYKTLVLEFARKAKL